MRHRAAAIAAMSLVIVAGADAAPSYDCAKATSKAERLICEERSLQWFDRQLARLYKLARDQAGPARQTLVADQRQFIAMREACGAAYECLVTAYETRLAALAPRVNVFEAYADYERQKLGGTIWLVRFGFDAGVNIGTIGETDHLCGFDADSATVTGNGVVKWRGRGPNACRIDIVPDGDDMRVETKNCRDYCGARATMDGLYSRTP